MRFCILLVFCLKVLLHPLCADICGECSFLAQYLYWQPRSDVWPYVERITVSNGNFVETSTQRVHTDYHSGMRFAFGYSAGSCRKWDIDAIWTHLVTRDTAPTLFPDANHVLFAVWNGGVPNPVLTTNANNNLTINFGDASLGCTLGYADTFFIHPHVGYRGAWVQNRINVDYTVSIGGIVGIVPFETLNKINLQGNGVRIGIDAEWNFWRGFSFVEKSGVGLLWSKVSVHQFSAPVGGSRFLSLTGGIFDTLHICAPVFDIFLGLAYDWHCPLAFIRHINAHIGWEENFLMGVLPLESFIFLTLSSRPYKGDLSLGGLTTGLSFFF